LAVPRVAASGTPGCGLEALQLRLEPEVTMKLAFSLLTLALAAFLAASPVSAEVRISDPTGGQIGAYLQKYSSLRRSGEKVVIDGPCVSACTMVLGLLPRDRLCATAQASFGFHAAWDPGRNGNQVTNRAANSYLMNLYPASVRKWISARGGLTPQMIYLKGSEMQAMVQGC
jgi:hypothetical protein